MGNGANKRGLDAARKIREKLDRQQKTKKENLEIQQKTEENIKKISESLKGWDREIDQDKSKMRETKEELVLISKQLKNLDELKLKNKIDKLEKTEEELTKSMESPSLTKPQKRRLEEEKLQVSIDMQGLKLKLNRVTSLKSDKIRLEEELRNLERRPNQSAWDLANLMERKDKDVMQDLDQFLLRFDQALRDANASSFSAQAKKLFENVVESFNALVHAVSQLFAQAPKKQVEIELKTMNKKDEKSDLLEADAVPRAVSFIPERDAGLPQAEAHYTESDKISTIQTLIHNLRESVSQFVACFSREKSNEFKEKVGAVKGFANVTRDEAVVTEIKTDTQTTEIEMDDLSSNKPR